jgi:DNA-binding SARP family transcriptional activator
MQNETNDQFAIPQPAEGGISFKLLDGVRAIHNGTDLPIGSPQQQSILALILLSRGPVSIEQMVDALWDDAVPASAPGVIRTYLSRLRCMLADKTGSELFKRSAGGYVCTVRPGVLDTEILTARLQLAKDLTKKGQPEAAADALSSALSLYRGIPLVGAVGPFAEAQRTRLERIRLIAVEDYADLQARLCHWDTVITILMEEVRRQPFHEHLHEMLINALYRRGQPAEALRVYRDVQSRLRTELGLMPGQSLQDLQLGILGSGRARGESVNC